jgi:hypothetical protein
MSTENTQTQIKEQLPTIGFTANRGLAIQSLDDAWRLSKAIAVSGFAPKGMDRQESILVAIQLGAELGMTPMAALQNIGVINGRPGIYGDAALALVRASGLLESYGETEVGQPGTDGFGIKVTVKRTGFDAASETFTVADAKQAKLWGKSGPWTDYPKRMLKFRARGFALRDSFGDVLKGMRTTEELRDTPAEPVNVTPVAAMFESAATVEPVTPAKRQRKAKEEVPAAIDGEVMAEEMEQVASELNTLASSAGVKTDYLNRWADAHKVDLTTAEGCRKVLNAWPTVSSVILAAQKREAQ